MSDGCVSGLQLSVSSSFHHLTPSSRHLAPGLGCTRYLPLPSPLKRTASCLADWQCFPLQGSWAQASFLCAWGYSFASWRPSWLRAPSVALRADSFNWGISLKSLQEHRIVSALSGTCWDYHRLLRYLSWLKQLDSRSHRRSSSTLSFEPAWCVHYEWS